MQIKYNKRKTRLKIRTYKVNTHYCQSVYTISILFFYTVSNFSFAVTRLNNFKVVGFYVLIILHKNVHNRRYHIIVTTQQTMQETKFLLEK